MFNMILLTQHFVVFDIHLDYSSIIASGNPAIVVICALVSNEIPCSVYFWEGP